MLRFLMLSFRLSLSIFWRAVPCWILLAALVYLLLNALQDNPIIFIFLVMLAAGTTMFFMMFSHIRSGLSVIGETTPPDLGKLFFKSFKFFRFVAMWTGMVSALSFAGLMTLGYFGLFDWEHMLELIADGSDEAILEANMMFYSPAVLGYSMLANVASQLAYCAIAVPMAANAAACSPKARDYEVFWGFGAYTGRMFLLTLASGTVLSILAVAYVVVCVGVIAANADSFTEDTLMSILTNGLEWRGILTLSVLVLLPLMAFVWWISIWCAGATLCFVDRRNIAEAKFRQEIECIYEEPMAREDLVAMRMSRMQGTAATPAE